jgi:hypothetical protein
MVTNTFFDLIFLPLCRQLAVWFVVMAVGRTLLISAAQLLHRLAMTAGKGLSGESASGKGYAAVALESRSPRTPLLTLMSAPTVHGTIPTECHVGLPGQGCGAVNGPDGS